MQTVDNYNLALSNANINNLMQRTLDDIGFNLKNNVDETLADAINRNMRELAQIQDTDEIEELKQYEFKCTIELYPMIQYIDANTADEAMELMEQIIRDDSFLHDLDTGDFHCTGATILQTTQEYNKYINSNKEQNNG